MAVTKLYTKSVSYNILADTTTAINTDGYKSAKLVITVDTPSAGTAGINIRNDKNVNMMMLNNEIGSTDNVAIDYRGGSFKQVYFVDLSTTSNVTVKYSTSADFAATKATVEVFFSYEELSQIEEGGIFDIYRNGTSIIDVKDRLLRLTLWVEGEDVATSPQIVINGSEDGSTWSGNINFVYNNGTTNSVFVDPGAKYTIWLNVETYKKIRIKINNNLKQHIGLHYIAEQLPAFEREVNAINTDNSFAVYGGGRYMKLKFNNFTVDNGSGQIRIFAKNAAGNFITPSLYTLDGKPILQNVLHDLYLSTTAGNEPCTTLMVFGDSINGGIILKYDEPLSASSHISYSFPSAAVNKVRTDGNTPTFTKNLSFVLSDEPFEPIDNKEELITKREKYDIYKLNILGKVIDAVNEDVLIKTGTNTFKYCRFGLCGIIYDVVLDSTHCPSLITGEEVKFAKLINYQDVSSTFSLTRILLFTNKNRILYNRIKDNTIGISYFREAPLYNLKKRFYPVNSKSDISTVAKYLPIFPDYDYNQFNGRVSGTDEFGLALPERGSSAGTLLEDWRKENALGKIAYSTFVLSHAYGCVFGQYNGPDADPWVAVSPNGKEFYIIETWASVEDYVVNGITTTKVDLSTIVSNAGGYTSGSLKATRRIYNVPTSQAKEPATPFVIGDSCVISSITVENNRTYLSFVDDSAFRSDQITTHRFDAMAPIVFIENVSASSEYDYICNSVKADGSDNTGIFFRLHRVDTNKYELLGDAGDPFEGNNVCRHIHSVSEAYGGFLIATGENYRHIHDEPFFCGGYLYFITADSKFAARPLQYDITNVLTKFSGTYRITSSEKGINRACGAVLSGDKKIIFVSDSVEGDRDVNNVSIEGRTETMDCKSYGVYMGDVKDCDDWSKYKNVCNMYEAGLGLVEHYGRLAVCGYSGPVHISPDFGNTWYTEVISRKYRSNPEEGSTLDVTGLANDGSIFYGNNKIVWKD